MKNQFFALFFGIIMLVGCSKRGDELVASLEVVDYAGRTVKLEKPAERIVVMADNSLVIVKQLEAINFVIALDSKTKGYLPLSIISETNPELLSLPDVGKTKNPNYEYIISLAPDLILFKGNQESSDMLQEKTGVPVACILSQGEYDFDIYIIIGKLLGKEQKAKEVISALIGQMESIKKTLLSLPEDQKKSAYIVVQNSKNNLFKTQRNSPSLDLARVNNVCATTSNVDEWGFAEVNKEEFLKLNPEIVFLDSPSGISSITKDEIYKNDTFQFVDAVKNNNVFHTHTFSLPKDYVYVVAEAFYYAHTAYPEIMTESIYSQAINNIFEVAYGIKDYYESWKKTLH